MKRMITDELIRLMNVYDSGWKRFKDNEVLRRLLTVVSLDILVKASAVILLPVYLRLMSQEEFGLFNYILSIAYAIGVLLNMGLFIPQSKLYHDDHDPQVRGKLIYSVHMLLLTGLLLIVPVIYFMGLDYIIVRLFFKSPIHYELYRFPALLVTLTSLFAYMLTNFFYTSENIDRVKKYSLFRVIGINGISILGLYFLKKTDHIELRLLAIGGTELALLVVFYGGYAGKAVRITNLPLLIQCLRLALPVMLSALFGIVITFGDKFILEKYFDYKVLSVYYLAVAWASVIPLLSNSLQNVWLPLFFKEKNLAKNLLKTNKLVIRLVWILTALSTGIFFVVAGCLQLNLIPERYAEIVHVLPLLLAGQVLLCVALLYSNYLVYFERTSLILWSGLIVSIISISLNLLLIPVLKMYGAGITLVVSNGSYLVIYYCVTMYYKKQHMPLHEQHGRSYQ